MFTLRCTRRLLDRLGARPEAEDVQPTTRLGDWYANLLFRPGGQVVLFVSEKSLMPVLVPAAPATDLVDRFQAAAADLLLRLGVPADLVEAEHREMAEVRIGKTASRQVLGTMTDFAFMMDGYREDGSPLDEVALKLAEAPCSPIAWKHPAAMVRKLLADGQ